MKRIEKLLNNYKEEKKAFNQHYEDRVSAEAKNIIFTSNR